MFTFSITKRTGKDLNINSNKSIKKPKLKFLFSFY